VYNKYYINGEFQNRKKDIKVTQQMHFLVTFWGKKIKSKSGEKADIKY
jgi:hypothetical protein